MSGGTCCQGIVEAVSGFLLLTRLVVWRDRLTHVMKEGQTWVPAGLAFSGQYGGETRPPRGLHPVEKASRPQWVLLCLRPVLGAEGTGVTPTLADGASDSGCNVCFRDSMLGEDVLPTLPRDHPPTQHPGGGGTQTSHLPGCPQVSVSGKPTKPHPSKEPVAQAPDHHSGCLVLTLLGCENAEAQGG